MSDRPYATGTGEDPCLSAPDAALAVIWPLLGRHIAFHRRLVDLTASVKAALLLSQLIYWTRHGRDVAPAGGWIHKTAGQWTMETGLSVKEQSTARAVLHGLALLDERRMGLPAKLHYRLRIEPLGCLLAERIGKPIGAIDWDDGVALAQLLGPSLAYHRILAGVGGGVHAGLLLSRALHQTRLQASRRQDHWIGRTVEHWTRDTGLTRRELDNARRLLREAGVWTETVAGLPPRLLVRVRLDRLLARLSGDARRRSGHVAAAQPADCGVATDCCLQKGITGMRQYRIPVSPEPPQQLGRIDGHGSAESACPYVQRSTGESVQPLSMNDDRDAQQELQPRGDLVFPEGLLQEERAAALLLLGNHTAQAQALLDELGARMQAGSVHTGPIAYLRGLVRRAEVGTFVPELGQRVAAARQRLRDEVAQRRQQAEEAQRQAAERATPEYRAREALRRARLREMLEAMRSGQKPHKES